MVAVMPISETAADAMIRVWKLARLSKDDGGLYYPSINILHPKHGIGGSGDLPTQGLTDAERIQSVVNRMADEIRAAFEAYHLGLIRGQSARGWPHKARALTLGVPASTYFRRVNHGRFFIVQWLDCADQTD